MRIGQPGRVRRASVASCAAIASAKRKRVGDVVDAVRAAARGAAASISNGSTPPCSDDGLRLQVDRHRRGCRDRRRRPSAGRSSARGRAIGRMPFLKQLPWKMSAKLGAMMQRMPKSSSAQGACSRLEPQPKLSSVIEDVRAAATASRLRTKSGRSRPSASKRSAWNRPLPSPARDTVFRNARRQDHVGVDIGDRQRRGDAGQACGTASITPASAHRPARRRSRPRRPSPARRDGCARPGPAAPRNCGWRSRRSARRARAGRG